jgi:MFS family permease
MPDLILEAIVLAALGGAAVIFVSSINSTIQLAVSAEMRGRVMALFSIVFLGSTPIGGPLTGWLAEAYDPRLPLVLAGISGLSAAWAARVIFTRMSERAGAQSRPLGASV